MTGGLLAKMLDDPPELDTDTGSDVSDESEIDDNLALQDLNMFVVRPFPDNLPEDRNVAVGEDNGRGTITGQILPVGPEADQPAPEDPEGDNDG